MYSTVKFIIISVLLLTLAGLAGILVRVLCLGKGRAFVNEHILRTTSKLVLYLTGIKLVYSDEFIKSINNKMIIFNHNSFLDVLILSALPFKNAYPIFSTGTRKFIHLYLCNLAISTPLVPLKNKKEERIIFFKKMTEHFKNNKYSILTSPEGVHFFTKRISKFNEEIFNMAMNANKDTTALFFKINPHENPFESFNFKATTVVIEHFRDIKTSNWTPKNLTKNVMNLRVNFMDYNKKFLEEHNA